MPPIEVLRLINNLGLGGAQRLVADYAKVHDRAKVNLTVAAFSSGEVETELRHSGVPVILCRRFGRYDVTPAIRLARIIRARGIQLLHANLFAARLWGRLAAALAGIPVVVTQHADAPRIRTPPHLWIEQVLAFRTHRWLTDHEGLRQKIIARYRAPAERVVTLYPAVDRDRLQPLNMPDETRKRLGIAGRPVVALWYGRFDEQKGLDILLSALTPDMNGHFILALKGEGPGQAALDAQVAQLRLSGIVIHAPSDVRIADLLQIADAFVMPSRWEGFPLSMIEAAAVGLPILAADLEGIREFYQNYKAMTFVEPNRASVWSDHIRRIIQDRPLRGAPLVDFDARDRAAKLDRIYADVLEEFHDR